MTYDEQHELDVKQLQEKRQEASDWGELSTFYRRHREVIACEANSKLILQYFAGDPLTAATLDDSLNHPRLRAQLAFQTEQESRAKVEEKILALLSHGGSSDAVAHEQAKFKYKSTEELRAQLESLEAKREMRAKTPEELRALIRPTVTAPQLPSHISKDNLLMLANNDTPAFRELVKRYGTSVDARLQGKG